jgi:hypothetical protein
VIIDAIRTWLTGAPGWLVLLILAAAAGFLVGLPAIGIGVAVGATRLKRLDQAVQAGAVEAELQSEFAVNAPQDAPQDTDGSDCHD